MTATTDQFLDLTRRGQEAVATAVRSWADTVQSVAGSFATTNPATLPDLHAFVDSSVEQAFDVAEKVLATQRQIARGGGDRDGRRLRATPRRAARRCSPPAGGGR